MGVKHVTNGRTNGPTDGQGVSRSRIMYNALMHNPSPHIIIFRTYFSNYIVSWASAQCRVYFAYFLLFYALHNLYMYMYSSYSHTLYSSHIFMYTPLLYMLSESPVYDDNVYNMRGALLKTQALLWNLGKGCWRLHTVYYTGNIGRA